MPKEPSQRPLSLVALLAALVSGCELPLPRLVPSADGQVVVADSATSDVADGAALDVPVDLADALDAVESAARAVAHEHRARFNTSSQAFVDVIGARLSVAGRLPVDRARVVLLGARIGANGNWYSSGSCAFSSTGWSAASRRPRSTGGTAGPWTQIALVPAGAPLDSVQLQLRSPDGKQAFVEDVQIVVFALPAAADVHSGSSDQVTLIDKTDWQKVYSLPISPSSAGAYLVLGVANAFEAPTTEKNVGVRWRDVASGAIWPGPVVLGGQDRYSLLQP